MNTAFSPKIPVIDNIKCINCNECLLICPTGAISKIYKDACAKCIKYCISMEVPCNPKSYIFSYEKCNACGCCIEVCKTHAIYWFTPIKHPNK